MPVSRPLRTFSPVLRSSNSIAGEDKVLFKQFHDIPASASLPIRGSEVRLPHRAQRRLERAQGKRRDAPHSCKPTTETNAHVQNLKLSWATKCQDPFIYHRLSYRWRNIDSQLTVRSLGQNPRLSARGPSEPILTCPQTVYTLYKNVATFKRISNISLKKKKKADIILLPRLLFGCFKFQLSNRVPLGTFFSQRKTVSVYIGNLRVQSTN